MKRGILVIAALFGLAQFTVAQVQHGTVIVWMATDKDLFIASDSRGIGGITPTLHRDNQCKIRALNGDLLFAASGIVAGQTPLGLRDVRVMAVDMAREESATTKASIDALAGRWARSVGGLSFLAHGVKVPKSTLWAVFAGSVGTPKRIHVTQIRMEVTEILDVVSIGEPEFTFFDPTEAFDPTKDIAVHVYGTGKNPSCNISLLIKPRCPELRSTILPPLLIGSPKPHWNNLAPRATWAGKLTKPTSALAALSGRARKRIAHSQQHTISPLPTLDSC